MVESVQESSELISSYSILFAATERNSAFYEKRTDRLGFVLLSRTAQDQN